MKKGIDLHTSGLKFEPPCHPGSMCEKPPSPYSLDTLTCYMYRYVGGRFEAFLWDNTKPGKKGKTGTKIT